MHISGPIKNFRDALARVKPAVAKRPTAVLAGVKIVAADGQVTLETSNLDLYIRTEVGNVLVKEDGQAIVSANQLGPFLKGKGDIEFALDGTDFEVRRGSVSILPTLSLEEWPAHTFVSPPGEHIMLNLDAIASVLPAVSRDVARPILTAVYFNGAEMVATDSYRLHRAIDPDTDYPQMLIPAATLATVLKNGKPAMIHTGELMKRVMRRMPSGSYGDPGAKFEDKEVELPIGDITITSGDTTYGSVTIEGEYPNYSSLIPDAWPHCIVFPRDAMIEALESAKKILGEQPVRLQLSEGSDKLVLEAGSDVRREYGKSRSEVTMSSPWTSDDLVLAFNPAFLQMAVTAGSSERCMFVFTDAYKPAMLLEDGNPRLSLERLVMPVRVS